MLIILSVDIKSKKKWNNKLESKYYNEVQRNNAVFKYNIKEILLIDI